MGGVCDIGVAFKQKRPNQLARAYLQSISFYNLFAVTEQLQDEHKHVDEIEVKAKCPVDRFLR